MEPNRRQQQALEHPQRAALYEAIEARPGLHLGAVARDLAMEASSVLWHVRKLQKADLVRTDRVNGFRVFYPVAGGAQAKETARAVTALQNENARRICAAVGDEPGATAGRLAKSLGLNTDTVRWHLRRLREQGLLHDERHARTQAFYAEPLALRALEVTAA
ncbi:MAG: winged helix-turn-helix transcriptional regulator [Thermoplasmatota archaeon]